MGLRRFVEKHRSLTAGAAILVTACALGMTYYQLRPSEMPQPASKFYFVDEDKTSFEDCFPGEKDNVPPFDHNGKPAVRARVYEVNGKKTILYMEKMTPEGKKSMDAYKAKRVGANAPGGMSVPEAMRMNFAQMLIKRTADKQWTPLMSKDAASITSLVIGSDGTGMPEVLPP